MVDQSHKPVEWLEQFTDMSDAEVDRALIRAKREAKRIVTSAVEQTKGRGIIPAEIATEINGLMAEPSIHWTEVLKSMTRSQVCSKLEESTAYPNPAFFNVEGIEPYPGFQKEFAFHILAHIDTSGSVTNNQFQDFINEIRGIIRDVDGVTVHLVMFDAAIQHIQKLDDDSELTLRDGITRRGGGGTSFEPSLKYSMGLDEESDWVEGVQDHEETPRYETPDLVIMFTDGYAPIGPNGPYEGGPLPEYTPPCPLMWVLTPNGREDELMEPLILRVNDD